MVSRSPASSAAGGAAGASTGSGCGSGRPTIGEAAGALSGAPTGSGSISGPAHGSRWGSAPPSCTGVTSTSPGSAPSARRPSAGSIWVAPRMPTMTRRTPRTTSFSILPMIFVAGHTRGARGRRLRVPARGRRGVGVVRRCLFGSAQEGAPGSRRCRPGCAAPDDSCEPRKPGKPSQRKTPPVPRLGEERRTCSDPRVAAVESWTIPLGRADSVVGPRGAAGPSA